MLEHQSIKYVITSLISREKYKEAHELLNFFESYAETVADYDILGYCALKSHHYDLRLKCAKFVYTHVSNSESLFKARHNLYTCYNALNYPEKALFYIEQNLKVKPNDPDTLMHKAFNLSLMGHKTEAENLLIKLAETNAKVSENLDYALSGKMLREGNTAKGILKFINTLKPRNHMFQDQLQIPFWKGEIIPGKTIIVNGEGGIGDEFINIRFFDHLKDLGMNPILYSSWHMYRPDTINLFRRHGYQVETNNFFFNKSQMWTHMMSLPGYLNLTEDKLWRGPYFKALRQEKNQLNDKKFKIGIKCNGNPYFEQDVYRTIPIEEILEIMPDDVSIYYFDKEKTHPGTISLKDKLDTWEDTLDYIDQMDMIVSSCTSLVHAAGALGKRTIVIVPIAKYYVWTSTRNNETTPWYGDNLTVLEQTKVRSWKEPLLRAKQLINEYKK